MKCSNCGAIIEACDNPECINNLHNSGSFTSKDYTIFCDTEHGNHYCEQDCLVEEFRSFGITGVETDLEDE